MKLWSSGERRKENDPNPPSEGRILNFWDLGAIGVGSSLAVALSVLVGDLIKNVTGPAVVVSIVLAGVTALFGGICFSEFGVRIVKSNSAYAYSYFWSRESAAFIFGWILILEYVAGTASATKGIINFTDALTEYKISVFFTKVVGTHFQNVFPYFDFASPGILLALTVLIIFGLKDSLIVKKLFTICNLILVAFVITAGAFKVDIKNWEQTPDENSEDGFAPFGALGIVKGTAIAFYGFIGFDRISVSGHEINKQARNIPAVTFVTVFLNLLAFGGIGVILSLVLPYSKINPSAAVPFAFQEFGWIGAKWVVAVITFLGFQTSLFGALFPLPRVIHAMANDGLLFPFLGDSHHKSKIRFLATLTGGALAAVGAGLFTFQMLVNLTVLATLFVYTILAINVVILRHSPKPENEAMLSDSWKNLINKTADVSLKAVLQNYFNFKEKQPTNLTRTIVMGNVILFCISSVGLGVIFNIFYDSLAHCTLETFVPSSIFLCVMFFNLVSIICQPKSQEIIPFKVPLMPIVPCLSIFSNIFLILTFESLTWILFSIWMAVGILPHFAWRLLKYLRGEVGENSLYEINRTNAVKLNESIWKIKSDKKSFYEGAANTVFSDDLEERLDEIIAKEEEEVRTRNEKTLLQLKQAEIIQTAEAVDEETAEPLGNNLKINFIRVDSAEVVPEIPGEEEQVHWECVAEIHTEEEFPQETIALEIVDNTYNFLTQISEELLKDDVSVKEAPRDIKEVQEKSENIYNSKVSNPQASQPDLLPESESPKLIDSRTSKSEKSQHKLFREELLQKIEVRKNNMKNGGFDLKSEYSGDPKNSKQPEISEPEIKEQNDMNFIALIVDNHGELLKNTSVDKSNVKPTKLEEQNKVKDFKDKLNQLLKIHINGDTTLTKNSPFSKPVEAVETHVNEEKNKEILFKTLNKSQIKGKLELLLAKGPPKRASLGGSFNVKIKNTNKENESEKPQSETIKVHDDNNILNGSDSDRTFSPPNVEDNFKEKILPLKQVDSELPKDVCC